MYQIEMARTAIPAKAGTEGTTSNQRQLPESQMSTGKLFDAEGDLIHADDLADGERGEVDVEVDGQATLGDMLEKQTDPLRVTRRQQTATKMVEDLTGGQITEYPLAGGEERPRDLISTSGEPCPECGSERTSSEQRQMGSADEGMTAFHRCRECGHNWRTGY